LHKELVFKTVGVADLRVMKQGLTAGPGSVFQLAREKGIYCITNNVSLNDDVTLRSPFCFKGFQKHNGICDFEKIRVSR
jgi:hypothetical protein